MLYLIYRRRILLLYFQRQRMLRLNKKTYRKETSVLDKKTLRGKRPKRRIPASGTRFTTP